MLHVLWLGCQTKPGHSARSVSAHAPAFLASEAWLLEETHRHRLQLTRATARTKLAR